MVYDCFYPKVCLLLSRSILIQKIPLKKYSFANAEISARVYLQKLSLALLVCKVGKCT